MTPYGCHHDNRVAGEGAETSDSRGREVTPNRTDKQVLNHRVGRRAEKGIRLPHTPTMHKSKQQKEEEVLLWAPFHR